MPDERGHFKRWRIASHESASDLAHALRIAELPAALLRRRGIADADAGRRFLEPKLTDLHDPSLLPGAVRAAERIVQAVRERQRIVIYGDYDVDGITASAILYLTLKAADPEALVECYVPHRVEEGYGLNAEAIAKLAEGGAQLIISVDCGITAVEPASVAKKHGVDLIITDHHEMGPALPEAHTLVHPRLTGSAYPFPDICGAGVAYKLAWQIARTFCGTEKVSETFKSLLVDLLSFAALGTIADVVPLIDENRTIAVFGLRQIKRTRFTGLNALIDAARLREEKVDSYHVGFVLGPRLNACGRMGHAKEAVDLLTIAPAADAHKTAAFLSTENERRRDAEKKILEQARKMVRELGYDSPDVRAIVMGHETWHQGVVGIVCSRLVEEFGRPTVLLNVTNGHAHGSARSIDGFNIHEAFASCAHLFETYGGHAMAAGCRLATSDIPAFRDAMIAYAGERLQPQDLVPLLNIDCEADLDALDAAAVGQMKRLEPFGRSNPSPVLLLRGVTLVQNASPFGQQNNHLSLMVRQPASESGGMNVLRCIGWKMADLIPKLRQGVKLDLAAEATTNTWNGRTSVELVIKDLRWV